MSLSLTHGTTHDAYDTSVPNDPAGSQRPLQTRTDRRLGQTYRPISSVIDIATEERYGRGVIEAAQRFVLVSVLVAAPLACAMPESFEKHERAERFVGLWAVEQNTHALYEVTFYDFRSNGRLVEGSSYPQGCTGHLSQHCVTGSVANCVPAKAGERCQGLLTCVFGDRWHSLDASTLVILSNCSDGRVRELLFSFNSDISANASHSGGAGATLISVDGASGWSHDNWPWQFRRCPDRADETSCSAIVQ